MLLPILLSSLLSIDTRREGYQTKCELNMTSYIFLGTMFPLCGALHVGWFSTVCHKYIRVKIVL